MDDDVQRVQVEVQHLIAVAGRSHPLPCRDRVELVVQIRECRRGTGQSPQTVQDDVEHQRSRDAIHHHLGVTVAELVEDEALAEALDDLTARRLGKLLRKAAGAELDGFRVERIGEECGAAIWQIVGVSGCLATTDSKKGAGDRRKKGIIARPCACPSNFC